VSILSIRDISTLTSMVSVVGNNAAMLLCLRASLSADWQLMSVSQSPRQQHTSQIGQATRPPLGAGPEERGG